jgi:hypothetical protein
MKRFFSINGKRNFTGVEVLSANEMLKVRGGADTKPASRDKDLYILETK